MTTDICKIHCSVCEGADHHWMDDCDQETGEPVKVCKHCDAIRAWPDDDDEAEFGIADGLAKP